MNRFLIVSCIAAIAFIGCAARAADAADAKPLMRQFMGINGHTIQFDAELYAPLCRLVRDYHGIGWDLGDDSSSDTTFPLSRNEIGWKDQSGRFRSHQGRVNWLELYGDWQKHGFEIDACLMLGGYTIDRWKNPADDAYKYGKAFAEFFGPSGKQKLTTSIEIGNEPAGNKRFSDDDYMTIFRNMARGIREGDPKLTILTCTAAVNPGPYSKDVNLFKDTPDLYDVINVHKYAQTQGWPTWQRTFPEDATFNYLGIIQATIDWRNANAPGKQVWLTEFGYDAATQSPPATGTFAKWVGVTDAQQAQWIVRSFLCFAAIDLDRAYLYWFNDGDAPSVHAASGVTRNYQPKPSYFAMRHLYQSLGDYRFARAVQQGNANVYVYEFIHGSTPAKRIWAVWSPTGSDRQTTVDLTLPGRMVKAESMPPANGPAPRAKIKRLPNNNVQLTITESPTYLWIE